MDEDPIKLILAVNKRLNQTIIKLGELELEVRKLALEVKQNGTRNE